MLSGGKIHGKAISSAFESHVWHRPRRLHSTGPGGVWVKLNLKSLSGLGGILDGFLLLVTKQVKGGFLKTGLYRYISFYLLVLYRRYNLSSVVAHQQ